MIHSAASHASVLPSCTQFKKITFFSQFYTFLSCNHGWSFPKCLKWSVCRLNSLNLKFISNLIYTLGAYVQYLQNDTPINWANIWWRSWIITTVQIMTRREIQVFTTIKISEWPDSSLLFQFHILQIFWSTFHSLLQPLPQFRSADCFMEPSSFDPLEICQASIAKASWNTICKRRT